MAYITTYHCPNIFCLHYVFIVNSVGQRKKETDRGNLRSCPHVLLSALSHPAGLRWRQTLPAAERGTSVYVCGRIVGWGGQHFALCVIHKHTRHKTLTIHVR